MKRLVSLALLLTSPLLHAEELHHHHGEPAPAAAPAPAPESATSPAAGRPPAHAHMLPSRYSWLKVDRLEAIDADGGTATHWDAALSWGGHFDRIWLGSEGERHDGHSEEVETQLYWSHAFSRWWDSTLGLRHDSGDYPSRSWAAFGVKGLAPYHVETEATAFVGDEGETALRLDTEYELLLTNRLILQPQVELDFFGKEDAIRLQGRGLAESEAGLRLRYEVRREFAPYVGVQWSRLHGDTARLAQAAGERVHDAEAVIGLRFWY